MGVAVLAGVAAVAFGLDTGLLARLPPGGANELESTALLAGAADPAPAAAQPLTLPVEGMLPELAGATTWLNSPPLSARSLRGKVVLIDFWTFACINCQRALPYVRTWAEKYKDQGLAVIGVHSPEFAFERKVDNVKRAARELGHGLPIAVDNDSKLPCWLPAASGVCKVCSSMSGA